MNVSTELTGVGDAGISLYMLFGQQVQTYPDAVAISFHNESLTYRELYELSVQLARKLSCLPDSIIAISTTRSIDMIVGVVAVHKAGKAYLPLDTTYPVQRLQQQISDAGVRYCLFPAAESRFFEQLGLRGVGDTMDAYSGADETYIDVGNTYAGVAEYYVETESANTDPLQGAEGNALQSNTVLPALLPAGGSALPNGLAYVLFTSGSTGRPKGVCMGNEAVYNLIRWQRSNSAATVGYKTLQFAPLGFDVSFQEIWSTLTTGGTLVLIEDEWRMDASQLLWVLETKQVNRLFLPFVALQMLAETCVSEGLYPGFLKEVMTAGEQLKVTPQLRTFFQRLSPCVLYNQYGPTECHVVTQLALSGDSLQWPDLPGIGTPIDHIEIFILDAEGRCLPPGATGELCIAGTCLADGYLNLPEQTAEKFRYWKHPEKGAIRIYHTGDSAHVAADGGLVFEGRGDGQVKVRGYRVELAEAELALHQLPGVKDAVVILREPELDVAQDEEKSGAVLNEGERDAALNKDAPGTTQLVAYLKSDTADTLPGAMARQLLLQVLPEYMIPDVFVWLAEFPVTASGKVDRKALPAPVREREIQTVRLPVTALGKKIAKVWEGVLRISPVGLDDSFFELGGNSLLAQRTVLQLREQGVSFPVTKLYQYSAIGALVAHLEGRQQITAEDRGLIHDAQAGFAKAGAVDGGHTAQEQKGKPVRTPQMDIAVIGMACRLPGADTPEAFWNLLKEGREGIRFFTDAELDTSVAAVQRQNAAYVKARGVINEVALFDAAFWGISPRAAEVMDPQQRVFLEIAREVLESTGHLPEVYNGSIGVYAGSGSSSYFQQQVLTRPDVLEQVGRLQADTLNEKEYLSTRTAYHLNLKGPAVSVFSACSTSLLAVTQAVEALRNGKCTVALAGGVSITTPVNAGHLYQEGAMFSRDGHTRSFDAGASGTVFSDGAGVVLLKPLEAAVEAGDTIYAVIRGVGVTNDGGNKVSFSAPDAVGQAGAIAQALQDAEVTADSISYVEAHGTATPIGDPIEIEGLKMAFGHTLQQQFCAIGSVKSNIGHLTHAAGVAGLIKTVLSLYHKQLPATLHYHSPNPEIDFANSPFYVNSRFNNWESSGIRRAGVSSFGVGGTNVHVVVEEYQAKEALEQVPAGKRTGELRDVRAVPGKLTENVQLSQPVITQVERADAIQVEWSQGTQVAQSLATQVALSEAAQLTQPEIALISWSAQSRESLSLYAERLLAYLQQHPQTSLGDIAWTLHTTRADYPFRKTVMAHGITHLQECLREEIAVQEVAAQVPGVAFLFPGQGAQFAGMGQALYATEPVYRKAVDDCAAIIQRLTGMNIREVLFTNIPGDKRLHNTLYTQPALFVTAYAMARWWMSRGILPEVLVGHSVGEFVAAHLAGVFNLEDALLLITSRGRLISELPGGSMLSVRAAAGALPPLVNTLSIAAVNAPELCVVAGGYVEIAAYSRVLDSAGILYKPLNASHAFHSHMMEPAVPAFRKVIKTIQLNIPRKPVVSTVTGTWLTDTEATSVDYWVNHMCATVQFAAAIQFAAAQQKLVMLEVGPGKTLATLALQQLKGQEVPVLAGIPDAQSIQVQETLLEQLGRLWQMGLKPYWRALYAGTAVKRITLPAYAYNKKYYWLDAGNVTGAAAAVQYNKDAAGSKHDSVHRQQPENASAGLLQPTVAPAMPAKPAVSGKERLQQRVAALLEDSSGIGLTANDYTTSFIELGMDSLLLTQAAIGLQKQFGVPVSFRQLNDTCTSVSLLADYLAGVLPEEPEVVDPAAAPLPYTDGDAPLDIIMRQLAHLSRQVSALQQPGKVAAVPAATVLSVTEQQELKKPFGAAARIDKKGTALSASQQQFLEALTMRYTSKTGKSKAYTQEHRLHMADPRVVSGFKPQTKELVYPVVVHKSKGSRLWDVDGNEYIDVLNGFGSSMLGYQPEVLKKAVLQQVEDGYEIGPQHVLSGQVARMICSFTGFDRAALCNTGSEAVLGAMRIARTVTGRSLIVAFTGSYHGIADEVIVRGTKQLKSFPAAPGIMPEAVQNMLILEYGTEQSLQLIKERAHELAAVLVEPVQSRRPEFQPVGFLKELRQITQDADAVLIFDEVITGFRSHPGGAQAIFGIRADIGTYGKVIGGGMPIGAIAGKRKFMDALDGGHWQYGDDSVPEAGVTYFAGTFVRHPLALAAAHATLTYLQEKGAVLQEQMNLLTAYLISGLNRICRLHQIPVYAVHFSSLWKLKFHEEYPYSELLFTLLREKGIHIWDGFPCFLTEAHTTADVDTLLRVFEESITALKAVQLIPVYMHTAMPKPAMDVFETAPYPAARLGKDASGNPAWFVPDPKQEGKYLEIIEL